MSVRPGVPFDTSGASGAAGAAASSAISAVSGRYAWVTAFEATWHSDGTGTVDDQITLQTTQSSAGTLIWKITTVAGAGGALLVAFPAPIRAASAGTALTLAVGATAGRAAITLTLHGYQL